MGDNTTTSRKRTYTDEQRQRNAAYLRQYRAAHPDKVKAWRRNYIIKAAQRLQAEGGVEHGGN